MLGHTKQDVDDKVTDKIEALQWKSTVNQFSPYRILYNCIIDTIKTFESCAVCLFTN